MISPLLNLATVPYKYSKVNDTPAPSTDFITIES